MFYCISRLSFAAGPDRDADRKQLGILCGILRARFKICVKIDKYGCQNRPTLTIAALSSERESLSQFIDAIVDFCEESGFGRIEDETSLLDLFE